MTGFEKLLLTKVPVEVLLRWLSDAKQLQEVSKTSAEEAIYEPFRWDNFSFSITDLEAEISTRAYVPSSKDLSRKKKQKIAQGRWQKRVRATLFSPSKQR